MCPKNYKHKIKMKKLVPAIIVIIFICIGFFIGRFSVSLKFKTYIRHFSKSEVLGRLLDKDEKKLVAEAYKNVAPADLDNFSYAIPNVPTPFVGNAPKPGKHNSANVNSMQFRKLEDLAVPKPPNTFRIFLVGGSTAFSSAAPDDNTSIAAYLEDLLNKNLSSGGKKFEVIIAANPAWASSHERIFIENKLSELEPDMVIAFSGINDVHWGAEGKNILWFRTFADDFFFDIINMAYQTAGIKPPIDVTDTNEVPVQPYLVAKRLLKNTRISNFALSLNNVKYLFCLQPNLAASNKKLTAWEKECLSDEKNYFVECYKEINKNLENFKDDNFSYINLSAMFDDVPSSETIFVDSYHFGDKGNEMIAEKILEKMKPIIHNQ